MYVLTKALSAFSSTCISINTHDCILQSLWALWWWVPKIESESTRKRWHKTAQALYIFSIRKKVSLRSTFRLCLHWERKRWLLRLWKLYQYLLWLRQLVLVAMCTNVMTGTFRVLMEYIEFDGGDRPLRMNTQSHTHSYAFNTR